MCSTLTWASRQIPRNFAPRRLGPRRLWASRYRPHCCCGRTRSLNNRPESGRHQRIRVISRITYPNGVAAGALHRPSRMAGCQARCRGGAEAVEDASERSPARSAGRSHMNGERSKEQGDRDVAECHAPSQHARATEEIERRAKCQRTEETAGVAKRRVDGQRRATPAWLGAAGATRCQRRGVRPDQQSRRPGRARPRPHRAAPR